MTPGLTAEDSTESSLLDSDGASSTEVEGNLYDTEQDSDDRSEFMGAGVL